MKAILCMPLVALCLVTACATNFPPGSADALRAERYGELMNACLAEHVEDIMEMSNVDPTFHYRWCRQDVERRIGKR